jgi:hypothetical protein
LAPISICKRSLVRTKPYLSNEPKIVKPRGTVGIDVRLNGNSKTLSYRMFELAVKGDDHLVQQT